MLDFVNIVDLAATVIAFPALGFILPLDIGGSMVPAGIALSGIAAALIGAKGISMVSLVLAIVFGDILFVSCLIVSRPREQFVFVFQVPNASLRSKLVSVLGIKGILFRANHIDILVALSFLSSRRAHFALPFKPITDSTAPEKIFGCSRLYFTALGALLHCWIGRLRQMFMPLHIGERLPFNLAALRTRNSGDFGFLSTTALAISVWDFVRGIIEGHRNLLGCGVKSRDVDASPAQLIDTSIIAQIGGEY